MSGGATSLWLTEWPAEVMDLRCGDARGGPGLLAEFDGPEPDQLAAWWEGAEGHDPA